MSNTNLFFLSTLVILCCRGLSGQNADAVAAPNENVQSSYVLGPEDQIVVHAFEAEEISGKPVSLDADGTVSLPLVGTLKAAGLTVHELEAAITKRLEPLIIHPSVSVSVSEYRSQPVSVLGEVTNAGVVRLRGDTTLLEVLSMAGGLRPDAGATIRIVRRTERGALPLPGSALDPSGHYRLGQVKVRELLDGRRPEENILITSNDVITVPRAQLVYVVGEVNRAGGFVLNDQDNMSVLQAVSRAEGLKASAAAGKARILRPVPNSPEKQEIALDIKRILRGGAPDVALKPDDVLFVPNAVTKAMAWRSLEAAFNIGTGIAIWRP